MMHEKKKTLVKNLEIENFLVSIDRASIEYQLSQADSNQKLLSQFQSVKRQIRSIENLEKSIFLKNRAFYCKNSLKHLNSTQIFQTKVFQPICLQNSIIKHILHQNQGTYNLGGPKQSHTQYHVQSLAKSNFCSVCN